MQVEAVFDEVTSTPAAEVKKIDFQAQLQITSSLWSEWSGDKMMDNGIFNVISFPATTLAELTATSKNIIVWQFPVVDLVKTFSDNNCQRSIQLNPWPFHGKYD